MFNSYVKFAEGTCFCFLHVYVLVISVLQTKLSWPILDLYSIITMQLTDQGYQNTIQTVFLGWLCILISLVDDNNHKLRIEA